MEARPLSPQPAGSTTSWKRTLIVLPGNRPWGWLRTGRLGPSPPTAAGPRSGATYRQGLGSSQHFPVSQGDVIAVQGTFQKKRAWCLFNIWLLSSTEACGVSAWAAAQPGSQAYACVSHTPAPSIQFGHPGVSSFTYRNQVKSRVPTARAAEGGCGQCER